MDRQKRKEVLGRVRFAHFTLGVGRVTVAAARHDDILVYGLAFCSPEDQFCRKEGRLRALRRLAAFLQASCGPQAGELPTKLSADDSPDFVSSKLLVDCVDSYLRDGQSRLPPWLLPAMAELVTRSE